MKRIIKTITSIETHTYTTQHSDLCGLIELLVVVVVVPGRSAHKLETLTLSDLLLYIIGIATNDVNKYRNRDNETERRKCNSRKRDREWSREKQEIIDGTIWSHIDEL